MSVALRHLLLTGFREIGLEPPCPFGGLHQVDNVVRPNRFQARSCRVVKNLFTINIARSDRPVLTQG